MHQDSLLQFRLPLRKGGTILTKDPFLAVKDWKTMAIPFS